MINNIFRNICIIVLSVHFMGILWCAFSGSLASPQKPKEKLIVKTISLQSPKLVAINETLPMVSTPEPEPEPELKPKEEAKPVPKSQNVKKKPVPTPEPENKPVEKPKPKPTPKQKKSEPEPERMPDPPPKKPVAKKPAAPAKPQISQVDKKKQELLAKAQAMVSKVGTKSQVASNLPTVGKLVFDSPKNVSQSERSYQDILALHLREVLKLPEYGEVKIKLMIENSGRVLNVEVISSKSEENRSYVKRFLPKVIFPSFDSFIKEDKHSFSITLKSD